MQRSNTGEGGLSGSSVPTTPERRTAILGDASSLKAQRGPAPSQGEGRGEAGRAPLRRAGRPEPDTLAGRGPPFLSNRGSHAPPASSAPAAPPPPRAPHAPGRLLTPRPFLRGFLGSGVFHCQRPLPAQLRPVRPSAAPRGGPSVP